MARKSTSKAADKRPEPEPSSDGSDADRGHYEDSMAIVKALHNKEKKGKKTTVDEDPVDIEALRVENEALVAALEVAQAELKNRAASVHTGSPAGRGFSTSSRTLIPVHKKSEYSMQRFREDVGCAGDENKRRWLGMRAKARNAISQAKMDLNSTWLGHSKTDIVLAINLLTDEIPELQRFDRNWGAEYLLVETFNHLRSYSQHAEELKEKKRLKNAGQDGESPSRAGEVSKTSSKRKRPSNGDTSTRRSSEEEADQTAEKRPRPRPRPHPQPTTDSEEEDGSTDEGEGEDGTGDGKDADESEEDPDRDVSRAKAKPTPKAKAKSQSTRRSESEQSSSPPTASKSQARDKPAASSPSKSSRKKSGKSTVERERSKSPRRSNNATGDQDDQDDTPRPAAANDDPTPEKRGSPSKKRKKQSDETPRDELPATPPSKKKKTAKVGKQTGRNPNGADGKGNDGGTANAGKTARMETRLSKKANSGDDGGKGETPAKPARKSARKGNGELNQGSKPDNHSPQPKRGNSILAASQYDLGSGDEEEGRGIRPLDRRALSSSEPETDSSEIE